MPGRLAIGFTMSDLSAMAILASEVRRHGVCNRSIDEIAARAGISRSSVKRALAKAVARKLISVEHRPVRGCKHDTNIIHISSVEWGDWLQRRPIGVQRWTTTETSFRKEGTGATLSSANRAGERGGMRFRQSKRE
jgi:DNA-binding transcriptional MocR family regulator